jgi:hypothetical protein
MFVRLAAHGLFICWSLEWTSPVDELWKYFKSTVGGLTLRPTS